MKVFSLNNMFSIFCNLTSFKNFNYSFSLYRYLRNNSRRVAAIKTLKDIKVKTANDDEDIFNIDEYNEMLKRVRQEDLEIEETFTKGENVEDLISESSKMYDVDESETKARKLFIKKQIIGNKYFKYEKETCLLTYAAKQQIRYLHKLDPTEWTPETIAKRFPISVTGVKKLLKSNFELRTAEKIKAHDDEVRKNWEILKSGNSSDQISFYTQRLWNEGKLLKENYNGNPNLPTASSSSAPKIIEKKKVTRGEFSAIVQKYIDYKAQKESLQSNQSEVTVKSDINHVNSNSVANDRTFNSIKRRSKFIIDDDENYGSKSKQNDEFELPLSQFKANIKNDLKFQKSPSDELYQEWVKQPEQKNNKRSQKPINTIEHFSPIPKYNKERIELTQEAYKSDAYIYDEKLGYMHPKGKLVKGKIPISRSSQKKNHKIGQCVYDEKGEFLYKLPS